MSRLPHIVYTSHDLYVQEAGLWIVPDSKDGEYMFCKLIVPLSALKSIQCEPLVL